MASTSGAHRWQFWIDRGAALVGILRLLGLAPGERIPPEAIEAVKMITTVATNVPPGCT